MIRFVSFVMILVSSGFALPVPAFPKAYELASPDGKLTVSVDVGERIRYSLHREGAILIAPSPISLTFDKLGTIGINPAVQKAATRSVNSAVETPVYFRSSVPDRFNELRIEFRGGYTLVFRAYDEGVGYRFETSFADSVQVTSEEATFTLAGDFPMIAIPLKGFNHAYEDQYRDTTLSAFSGDEAFAALPVVVKAAGGVRLGITEADLYDYPAMYLKPEPGNRLAALFPPYPLAEEPGGHMNFTLYVTEAASYIARTHGKRTYPWRVVIVAGSDKDLLANDLVYLLSRDPEAGQDFSWVKPGKVAWDWWHANMVRGVGFESGVNTDTYKHYIDFAARNGFEYVNLDEGWSDQFDLMKLNPEVNVEAVIEHAKSRNVGVILWVVARTLDAQLQPAMDLFERLGVSGLKVDFMQRDDQPMVNYYERIAREAARRKMLVNFHGAYKPTGMNRKYPNIINHEAVRGLEYNKFDPVGTTPGYAATIPFVRMLAGYMDYTPGAMTNAQAEDYKTIFRRPMSQGTRAHQLALYVMLFAPLQMLSDAPYRYEAEPEVLDLLRRIPETWDETVPMAGEIGRYAALARRKGEVWYVAALEGGEGRRLDLGLSFLTEGRYRVELFRDGPNAHRLGEDYVREERLLTARDVLSVDLAPGGGAVAVVRPVM